MRGGCAISLAVSGFGNTKEIMNHIGWFSQRSFDRYSRISNFVDNSVGSLIKEFVHSPQTAERVFEEVDDTTRLPLAFS